MVHRHTSIIRSQQMFLKPLRLPDGNVSYLFSFVCIVAVRRIAKTKKAPSEAPFLNDFRVSFRFKSAWA